MNIGEFFVSLGVVSDKEEVKQFTNSIRGMTSSTVAGIFALAGLSVGLVEMTSHTIEMVNGLGAFRSETGLSIFELQKWQQAAQQFGISGDVVTSSVMGIADAITQITKLGNGAPAMAFGRLGVSWSSKNPFEILKRMREVYKTKDPNEFRTWASQVGVSPEMTRLFALPDNQFNKAMNTAPAINDASMKAIQEFQQELARFNIVVMQSFVPVLRELTPYMGMLAKSLGGAVGSIGSTLHSAGVVSKYGAEQYPGGGFITGLIAAAMGSLVDLSPSQNDFGKYGKNSPYPQDKYAFEPPAWIQSFEKNVERLMDRMGQPDFIPLETNVHQHITVASPEDADRVGSRHLQGELNRTTKHLNRQGH